MGLVADFSGLLGRALFHHPVAAVVTASSGLLVVLTLISTARDYYRLRHIKGPFLASISKWWLIQTVSGTQAYLDFWDVNERYGETPAPPPPSD
jgi:hypothetical protein